MREALRILDFVQPLVFAALGLAAFIHWRRTRGEAAAWLAITFIILGVVVDVSRFLPEESDSAFIAWIERVIISVVVLFPYCLYRFMATFGRPHRWVFAAVTALTAVTAAIPLLLTEIPGEGEPRSTAFQLFVYLLVVQWVSLSVLVAWRLWRGGSDQPSVARRRMRTLSLGSIGFSVAIVLAGASSSGEQSLKVQLAVQVFALGSALLFWLGFAPPAPIRILWRRREETAFRNAEVGLMEASTPEDVSLVLLPHISQLVGGRGAVLVERDGDVIGSHGLDETEARALARRVAAGHSDATGRENGPAVFSVPMQSGWLTVETSPFTPFFGREETDMLRALALLGDLSLARVELVAKERLVQEQLLQAQELARVGSWEWDIETNEVLWSKQMYRMLKLSPDEFVPTYAAYVGRIHPNDRDAFNELVNEALVGREPFVFEHRCIGADGEIVLLQSRGKVITDDDNKPIKMIGSAQDVTEVRRQEVLKEQFIANAAHELRTPLTTVIGFLEILTKRRDEMPEERVQEAFEIMTRSGRRLGILVNNLLDLTKLQQGEMTVRVEPVSLVSVSKDALESTPPPDGVSVELKIHDHAQALVDRHRLEQILSNLLTNAYRYGGNAITLESVDAQDGLVLSFSDNGPGVDDDLIPHLFEPFTRGVDSAGVGGSGLGLAIVRSLVEACGGKVWYERVTPSGARFCVRLVKAA